MARNGGTTHPNKEQQKQPKKPAGKPAEPKKGRNEYDYLKVPGNKQVHKEATAATEQQYRPTERAISAERRASEKRTKDIGGWWNEYLKEVGASQTQTDAANAAAAAQGQAYIASSSAADNANTSALDSQASASAAARGQTQSPAASERGAAAQAQRNYLSSALGGAAAARGANESAYFGKQRGIGKGQKATSQTAQAKTTQKIEKDRTELSKQRGQYATTKLGELQEKNRNYLIQKKAYGLDKNKYLTEKEEGKAAARTAASEAQLTREENRRKENNELHQHGVENRQNQEQIENEPKPGKNGKTPKEERAGKEGRHNAWVETNNLYAAAKKKPKTAAQWHAFAAGIGALDEITPSEASWAVEKLRQKIERQERAKAAKEAETGANSVGPGGTHR